MEPQLRKKAVIAKSAVGGVCGSNIINGAKYKPAMRLVQPLVRKEIAGLDLEKVMEYLSEQQNEEEMVHMTSVRTMGPYNLRAVTTDSSPREWEITKTSINGAPLEGWLRERKVFTALKNIRFLQQLPMIKAFQRWKANVRRGVFLHCRRALSSRLLLLKPLHRTAINATLSHLHTMHSTPLTRIPTMKRHTPNALLLDTFVELQNCQLEEASEVITKTLRDLDAALQTTFLALEAASVVSDVCTVDDLAALFPADVTEATVVSRAAQLKHRMHTSAMLPRLKRLTTFMIEEGLLKHTLHSICMLVDAMCPLPNGRSPLCFRSTIALNLTGTPTVLPTQAQVSRSIDSVVTSVRRTVAASTHLHIDALLDETPFFKKLLRADDSIISDAYKFVEQYVDTLEEPQRWVDWVTRSWPAAKESWDTHNDRVTTEDFKVMVAKLESVCQCAQRRLVNTSVGVLYVNHTSSRSLLLSGVKTIRCWFERNLTRAAAVRSERLQKTINTSLVLLQLRHTDLDKWAAWVVDIEAAEAQRPAILASLKEIGDLFALISATGTSCDYTTLHDTLLEDTVQPSMKRRYLQALDAAKDYKKEQLPVQQEALCRRIDDIKGQCKQRWKTAMEGVFILPSGEPAEVLKSIEAAEDEITKLKTASETCSKYEKICGFPTAEWRVLAGATEAVYQRKVVWTALHEFEMMSKKAMKTHLSVLNVNSLMSSLNEFQDVAAKLCLEVGDAVSERLEKEVQRDSNLLPLFKNFASKAMEKRHWDVVLESLKLECDECKTLTMEQLVEHGVLKKEAMCAEVSRVADGEYSINNALDEIERAWCTTHFEMTKHNTDAYILGTLDTPIQQLEDQQVQIQAILASKFVSGVAERVDEWATRLSVLADILEEWIQVQKTWLYLEFIFSSPDINQQLPDESRDFKQVDTDFKKLTNTAYDQQRVIAVATPAVLGMLRDANSKLDVIQKKLESYLETKRAACPRFYFLSNDELLSILSDVRNPAAVQPHLIKVFDNMKSVNFNDEGMSQIAAMVSSEGEVVQFTHLITPTGGVETWLVEIEATMKATVKHNLKEAFSSYHKWERVEWYFQFPAQCITCTDMIIWTQEVEAAISSNTVPEYITKYKQQLAITVDVVKGDLKALERQVVCTIILMDVHARDCVVQLSDSVVSITDFEWARQLRYYWEDGCMIKHCAAEFVYGYEYLGNQPRLVITPLTDRAFLTCTGALSMNLGAAPQGPAGTGKTESVKDLGKALARQVVVFNCSDGLNHKMMSQMFSGLAQAGAWACFDEFNRIPLEVLSVVAQQMLEITSALAVGKHSIQFVGRHIALSRNFGVFITMNPGYAGRTELPDNLKALFRPICMMIPDYTLIAEVMFFSEGFQEASILARKMVQLYKLSSEQLSKQDHYDFGMRAVKSILVIAGSLKRSSPDNLEELLLIKAMRDSNIPKFLREDTLLFVALIKDLFPEFDVKEVVDEDLIALVKGALKEKQYQTVPMFVMKVMQLYDTLVVRHGVMTVGQTMTGKSVLLKTLFTALNKGAEDTSTHYRHVVSYSLNPKSVSLGELYGEVNPITQEWHDGILSKLARNVVEEATAFPDEKRWLVFDGPVDTIWSENLNTVLDDNRMLCLVNGERIKMPGCASFIFEVQDLKVASPATVSRCGMVFLEPYYLDGGWRPAALSYIQRTQLEISTGWDTDCVVQHLEATMPMGLRYLRRDCKEWMPSVDVQVALSLLALLKSLLMVHLKTHDSVTKEAFSMMYVVAFTWSVGANIADTSRQRFDEFAKGLLRAVCKGIPENISLHDLSYDAATCQWVTWADLVPSWEYSESLNFFDIVIPTPETVCYCTLLQRVTAVKGNVLLSGPTGVGKSIMMQSFLFDTLKAGNPDSHWCFFNAVFSAQTTAANLQEKIESKLHKKKNTLLGAPPGKGILLFIDDANMPALEIFGASPPIELIRQVIGQEGFYDRNKLIFKKIEDMLTVAVCGLPGGGRNDLTPRMTSLFHLMAVPELSLASVNKIFTEILGGFFRQWDEDLAYLAEELVGHTTTIFRAITTTMLPTPAKSHYTFNLRDIGKVVQGLLQASPATSKTAAALRRVWCHEATRIFHDRLIDDEDRAWWWEHMEGLMKDNWEPDCKHMLLGDLMNEEKQYTEMENKLDLATRMSEKQSEYNKKTHSTMDLVFFNDAVAHLSRICRVIRVPRGNALLVGVGGSGRQSLTTLGAFLCGLKLFKIAISKSYGMTEFREDIKNLLLEAGCCGKGVVLFMTDSQIVDESMLEDTNNILNTGEIPNLMQPEDNEKIAAAVAPVVRAQGKMETRTVILQEFTNRCREHLKIILAVSPVGDKFRQRLRMFPSLVNCMTIDWFTEWPKDALLGVAKRTCSTIPAAAQLPCVAELCVDMHLDVRDQSIIFFKQLQRRNYTTPTSYLALLSTYKQMLDEYTTSTGASLSKYRNGLEKLFTTQTIVDNLKVTLREMQPKLQKASEETSQLMVTVQQEQIEADVLRSECKQSKEVTQQIMNNASSIKDECQEALDKAMPAYYGALDALKSLNKSDITEIRSMASPPNKVKLVLEAVLVLLGEKTGWDTAKKVMGSIGFIDRLREYDKDNVSEKLLSNLQRFIKDAEFQPEIVKKSSMAAMSLCLWVRAIDNYSAVSKDIAPKKQQLAVAEAELDAAQHKLAAAQAHLKEVEDKVEALQVKMREAVDYKDQLEDDQRQTQVKLHRAEQLVNGLSSEQVRWIEAEKRLSEEQEKLVGTILLAAACIAYVGPFTSAFRETLITKWTAACKSYAIPCSDSFNLASIADPVKVRQWGIDGLPLDNFSKENATVVSKAMRWPLCIDPQSQAYGWIKKSEKSNGLTVTKLTDPNFMRVVETGIRVGSSVLLEDVSETLDPSLDPILQKSVYKSGGRLLIMLGDTEMDYDPNFKLYITTKMPNPHFLPELQIKVTVVNFTVTSKGLEDQLLADVVRCERADLEQQQDKMVVEIAEAKDQLDSIESNILRLLAAASGNILEDEVLINTLSESKTTSTSIALNLTEVQETSAKISAAREEYRPVASRGSMLYTSISSVAGMSHMYQHSLDFFKQLFNRTLLRSPKIDCVKERVASLLPAVTRDTYRVVCRGLFAADKPMFAFLVATEIHKGDGMIKPEESRFLITGGGGAEPGEPEWLPAVASSSLRVLDGMCMEGVVCDMQQNQAAWREWYQSDTPHTAPLPGKFNDFPAWRKLLFLRAVRKDKLTFGMAEVVRTVLGPSFTDAPPFNLDSAYEDSTPFTSIILVLTTGTDPTTMFLEFAEEKGWAERKSMLSLGQDQGHKAQQMIERGAKEGEWVYLQNCHVYGSWMPTLERLLEKLSVDPSSVHPDFRLWLTTMPCDSFPVSILQNGVKVTKEPPKGLKANLRDSLSSVVKPETYNGKSRAWKRLLFALTFFHGVIQERRKYGALGWNVRYEWSGPDLHASVLTLDTYLTEGEEVPWTGLEYLTGVIHYGGRVTDFIDLKCLRCLLVKYFSEDVMGSDAHCFTPDGVYKIPSDSVLETIDGLTDYVGTLPCHEEPGLFGLHANADITFDKNTSSKALHTLAGSQPVGGSGDTTLESSLGNIISNIQTKMPVPIRMDKAHPETYKVEGDTITPLGTFCTQEVQVMNNLLKLISKTLAELSSAIKGEAIMSDEMERMAAAFMMDKVPEMWMKRGYLSLKGLASWVVDTAKRVKFLADWNNNGPPERYWVPGFFFPQGFMTALLQSYSRSQKVPIDEVQFKTLVGHEEGDGETRAHGAYSYGLFLEGAGWDPAGHHLCESSPSELFISMPDVYLKPVSTPPQHLTPVHACPLYKVSSRAGMLSTTGLSTNFVLSVDLPSGDHAATHWVLRGAALLCMLDE